jgi:predicted restriction endonuclease
MDFESIKNISDDKLNESQQQDKILLNFLINNYTNVINRNGQNTFRERLVQRYKNCIITNSIADECDASHIIPYSESGTFDITNGLLLSSNLHKTFDKYYWSIEPYTKQIHIRKDIDVGTIRFYEGVKLNIDADNKTLKYHYDHFIKLFSN